MESCCHARFCKNAIPTIELTNESVAELPAFINLNKIKEDISFSESNVVFFNSRENVERYSVCADSDVQLVTIFTVSKAKQKNVQCNSSICRLREDHSRSLSTLQSHGTICKHLIAFREFYLANISQTLKENIEISDENERVYESIAHNHCLPDNTAEVNQYT